MYRVYSNSFLCKFLIFVSFVGIISNRISSIVSYLGIVLSLALFFFFEIKKGQIRKTMAVYSLFLFSALYLSFVYQILKYSISNLYYIQFFGSQLLFFYIFGLYVDMKKFIEIYLPKFLFYMVIILFISIVVDFFLIKIGMMSSQLMFKPNPLAWAYWGKPMGIFGQFSVNTTYAVVFYLLYLSVGNGTEKQRKTLFLMVTAIIVLESSGSGYVVYLLLLTTLLWKYKIFKYFLIPLLAGGVVFVIQGNFIDKLSSKYLLFMYDFFYNILYNLYLSHLNSIGDFLFGINGMFILPIDFGPLFLIAKVGFLYFVLYSIVILYMVYNAPDRYFRMAIIALVLANLHYPTLFYPVMNVLLPILLLYVSGLKSEQLQLHYEGEQ